MLEFLAVGAGGFVGSCLRFLLTKLTQTYPLALPLDTLCSNALAGLFLGCIMGLQASSFPIGTKTRLFLASGLCGGLSTFSTFTAETVHLLGDGNYAAAVCNIGINLFISFFFFLLGMSLIKLLCKLG